MNVITSYLFSEKEGKKASSLMIEARHVAEQVFESHGEWLKWEDYVWLTFSDTFIGEVAHSGKGTIIQLKAYGKENNRNSLEVRIGGKSVYKTTLKRAKAWAQKEGYI